MQVTDQFTRKYMTEAGKLGAEQRKRKDGQKSRQKKSKVNT